jgi:transcriptional regulator with XRE-family HTH domain
MNPAKPRPAPRCRPVPAGYLELVRVLDERRRARGLSHEELCRLAGIAARSWAKYLAPDAASGRIASKGTLDKVRAVLGAS